MTVLWMHCATCREWYTVERLSDSDACAVCGTEPDELWAARPVATTAMSAT